MASPHRPSTWGLSRVQLRAIRNGVVAAVATALVGFALTSLFSSGTAPADRATSSPSAPATCQPAAVAPPKGALRGLSGRFQDAWLPARSDGWAVGYAGDERTDASGLIARWNGSTWTPWEAAPSAGPIDVLEAVDGTGRDDAWAVGWASDGFSRDSLVAHFDGTSWQRSSSPTDAALFDVLAIAPDDAWAVGASGNPEFEQEQALALHWDGTRWSQTPVPVGPGASGLRAIAGGPGDLWAVGFRRRGPLLLHYDGTRWERPTEVNARGPLNDVSVAGGAVWVAGADVLAGRGGKLARVASAPRHGSFSSIVATGPSAAWAVGTVSTLRTDRALALRIQGDAVRPVPVAAPGTDALQAATIGARRTVVAVGWHRTGRQVAPLVATLEPCA